LGRGGILENLALGAATSALGDFLFANTPKASGVLQVMFLWILFCAPFAILIWVIWLLFEHSTEKNWASIFKGVGLGMVSGTCVGLGGFYLANTPTTRGMGSVMFLLVPLCAGFAIAMVTRGRNATWAATLLAVLISLAFLVAGQIEGVLCAILAFPLLLFALGVGAVIGHFFRRHVLERFRHQITGATIVFALTPAIILAGHHAELPSLDTVRRETVSNTIFLQASPQEVWANIQSIDSISGTKPLLMHFGLPVPLRCTLERKSVGAKRTCYFENGFIEEIITEWAPPYSMQLTIDRTNMPGRHWLGFEKAAYELHAEGSGTRLTRTTKITSHLYPVWYWRYFERLGVSSEHDYLLQDLSNRLNR
jgi:hypothetical protein